MDDNKSIFWINDPSILYKNSQYLEFIPTGKMNRISQLNALTRLGIYFLILMFIINGPLIWTQISLIFILLLVILYLIFIADTEGMQNEIYRMRGVDINSMGDEDYPERDDERPEPVIIQAGYRDPDNKLIVDDYLKLRNKNIKDLKYNFDDYTKYEKNICKLPTKDNPFMNPVLSNVSLEPDDPQIACNSDDDAIKDKMTKCFDENLYRDVEDLFDRENSQRQFYTVPQQNPNDQTSFANWCYKSDNICKVDQGKCLKYEDLRYTGNHLNTER